jgi:hypothetical protein
MLSVTGESTRLRDGVSRREFMRIGGLGAAGLSLPELLQARAASPSVAAPSAERSFGKAKACILLVMYGGPSQLETFDMKPEAPANVHGEFRPHATNVPGLQVCEHLPLLAGLADKYAVIRSVTQRGVEAHSLGFYAMLTGQTYNQQVGATSEAFVRPHDHPHVGSVLARLRQPARRVPPFVALPWRVTSDDGGGHWTGQSAGFLGRAYDPLQITQGPNDPDFRLDNMLLARGISWDRLNDRRGLLDAFNRQLDQRWRSPAFAGMDSSFEKAFALMSSPAVRPAFDLTMEPANVRDRYSRTTFGQSLLLARRLVEHGVPLVTVYWPLWVTPEKSASGGWDTHVQNFEQMKVNLLPLLDRAFAALLEDLSARGLLDETLVVWTGEFGRTPRINGSAGRDHWGACSSAVLAGGGIRGGQVYGRSDRIAGYPVDSPVRPADIHATIYHCLGISPHAEIADSLGRPLRVCDGELLHRLV